MSALGFSEGTVVGSARVSRSREEPEDVRTAVDWSRGGHVIDAGEAVVHVPLLGLSVADVSGCSADATLMASDAGSCKLGFSLFGLSLSAGFTVSVEDTVSLTCEAGGSARVEVRLPVLWTLKGPPGDDDYGLWVELEPVTDDGPLQVVARSAPPQGVPVASRHYSVDVDAPTLKIKNVYRYERSATFELKLEVPAIPVGASVTLGRTASQALGLEAEMSPGHDYLVSRWAGLAGGMVATA